MSPASAAISSVAVAALVAAGCASPGTSLAIEIQSNGDAHVAALVVVIEVDGEPTRTVQAPAEGGPPPLPGKLVLRLPDADVAIHVDASGTLDDGTAVSASAFVRSAAYQETRVTLILGVPSAGTGLLANLGDGCGVPQDCISGNCVEGVCCDTACDGACATCVAANGATADGTCGPRARGTVCRAAAGDCDVPEACDGAATTCPADALQPATFVCRPKTGACDLAETCTGADPACPADTSTCNATDYCNGTSCVAKKAQGTTCAGAVECTTGFCTDGFCCNSACNAGPCDACAVALGADANGTCKLLGGAIVCRAATGPCDAAESCSGMAGTCPPDALKTGGTVCRGAAGACDLPEACTGASPGCPNDKLAAAGTICRAAVSGCDLAESCSGTDTQCPADAHRGLVLDECPAAGQVPCHDEVTDACGNDCGYDGQQNCGTVCGAFQGPNCALPGSTVLAGPHHGLTMAQCQLDCGSYHATCCEWYDTGNGGGDCYPETGNCTVQCGEANWWAAQCN